jgi:hypothetical protein
MYSGLYILFPVRLKKQQQQQQNQPNNPPPPKKENTDRLPDKNLYRISRVGRWVGGWVGKK